VDGVRLGDTTCEAVHDAETDGLCVTDGDAVVLAEEVWLAVAESVVD
jgi:hypothetical protein